ncbi:hypothetical protein QBC40DRAFT_338139 [Triangularia verruculosa]|uniref:Uncharacterized protein n=1 Tax=Triangularia verruculosa TaxID=2587418 RepID=A0AAN6XNX9_9PEZI|nr:hypothetical protein QBC40DRAFT_338139 [Triangularia verruculosa]
MFTTSSAGALRAGARRLETTVCHNASLQRRLFSVTSQRAAGFIVFKKGSNPELQERLDTLYNKIVLPSYLSEEQQRKLTKTKYKEQLRNDPITMEIDGEIHKFRYVDPMKDMPSASKLVKEAVDHMDHADYQNLHLILKGFKRANRKLTDQLAIRIIRRAHQSDRLDAILDCARQVELTGFKLDTPERLSQLLTSIQTRAVESAFKADPTRKALKQTEKVIDLLEFEGEGHRPSKRSETARPFYHEPMFLGLRLNLAASLAVKTRDSQDVDGKVTQYAEQLVHFWPENTGILELQPDTAYEDPQNVQYLLDRNNFLFHVSPVLHGLQMAAKVVDPGLSMKLQHRADALENEIRQAYEHDERMPGLADVMYTWLFNSEELLAKRKEELSKRRKALAEKQREEMQKRKEEAIP